MNDPAPTTIDVLLAPHLANHGYGNTAFIGDYKGVPMLFAERNGTALAVACAPGWRRRSAGFVGVSDGWQDLTQNHQLAWTYDRAENGNVALVGEVDLASTGGTFVLALAFGGSVAEAGHRARASLFDGFARSRDAYADEWRTWQRTIADLTEESGDVCHRARTSAAVLRCHEEKRLPGAIIASLSIPWGADKGDADLGGYRLAARPRRNSGRTSCGRCPHRRPAGAGVSACHPECRRLVATEHVGGRRAVLARDSTGRDGVADSARRASASERRARRRHPRFLAHGAARRRPQDDEPAYQIVSPDVLALVRFGLRAPDDPRIVNTIRAIDALLKVETPHGPVWRRYNGDRYGEHEDGSAFDGTGIGRCWPLLTGERAHYEVAAGRLEEASNLLRTFEGVAGQSGLIPEQVWDIPDVPERERRFGGPQSWSRARSSRASPRTLTVCRRVLATLTRTVSS
jgi:GH15 family glucan-1,4-alpha-glucosidase